MNDPYKLTPHGVNLLKRVASHIEKAPEEFDMGHWECGTTACIAGHIARLKGQRLTYEPEVRDFFNVAAAVLSIFETPPESIGDVPLFVCFNADRCTAGLDEMNPADCVTAIHRFVGAHS